MYSSLLGTQRGKPRVDPNTGITRAAQQPHLNILGRGAIAARFVEIVQLRRSTANTSVICLRTGTAQVLQNEIDKTTLQKRERTNNASQSSIVAKTFRVLAIEPFVFTLTSTVPTKHQNTKHYKHIIPRCSFVLVISLFGVTTWSKVTRQIIMMSSHEQQNYRIRQEMAASSTNSQPRMP